MRIDWRPAAERDLDEIWLHIARDRPLAADRMLTAIVARYDALLAFPELGPRRRDIHPQVRALNVEPYVVLYTITASGDVEIVRVVHGARDLPGLVPEDEA